MARHVAASVQNIPATKCLARARLAMSVTASSTAPCGEDDGA